MLQRREFITLLSGAAAAPLMQAAVARAQQPMPVVGLLQAAAGNVTVFKQTLAESGFVEGRNVTIARRSAEGRYELLPVLAAELVRRQVAVIAALTPVAALAAKAATTSIPIVFAIGSDPVKDGLVASLARPGGNITGVTFFNNLLAGKRIELLHDIVPDMAVTGLLLNPTNANADVELNDAQTAARAFGLQLVVVRVAAESELEDAFARLDRQRATTLLVAGDAYLNSLRNKIAELSQRHRIATCHANREGVQAGGLASYGANRPDSDRQFGVYVVRVLKGEKPADLPVMQPTKFEMVINLKTAKALGLTISRELLFRADEVIE